MEIKIAAFDGSPRPDGNSSIMLRTFINQAAEASGRENEINAYVFKTDKLDLKPCRGCLYCNAGKGCIIRSDQWEEISGRVLEADILVFSSPIYFHHTTSSMKRLIDRFRSFIHVQITEEGLIHTPYREWNKKIFLFTAHGSPDRLEAEPLDNLFRFIKNELGGNSSLDIINAVRLAVPGQILFEEGKLTKLYEKLEIPSHLAEADRKRNLAVLGEIKNLAESSVSSLKSGK